MVGQFLDLDHSFRVAFVVGYGLVVFISLMIFLFSVGDGEGADLVYRHLVGLVLTGAALAAMVGYLCGEAAAADWWQDVLKPVLAAMNQRLNAPIDAGWLGLTSDYATALVAGLALLALALGHAFGVLRASGALAWGRAWREERAKREELERRLAILTEAEVVLRGVDLLAVLRSHLIQRLKDEGIV